MTPDSKNSPAAVDPQGRIPGSDGFEILSGELPPRVTTVVTAAQLDNAFEARQLMDFLAQK